MSERFKYLMEQRDDSAKSRYKIMNLLREDPKMSASKLSKQIGISVKGVEKRLAKLREEGLIEHIGAPRGGYWIVKD